MLHMIATYSYYMMDDDQNIRMVKVGVQQYWIVSDSLKQSMKLVETADISIISLALRWRRFWTTWERNNLEANQCQQLRSNIRNDLLEFQ